MNPHIPTFHAGSAVAIGIVGFVIWFAWSRRPAIPDRWYTCAATIFVLGALNFGPMISLESSIPNWVPLPISRGIEGLALDANENIYVATEAGRVQKFNPDGHFVTAMIPKHGGGTFRMQVSPEGEVTIHTSRGNLIYKFANDGSFISRDTYRNEDVNRHFFYEEIARRVVGSDRIVSVSPGMGMLRIERIGGGETIRKFPAWPIIPLFIHPMLGWLLAIAGFVGMSYTGRDKEAMWKKWNDNKWFGP